MTQTKGFQNLKQFEILVHYSFRKYFNLFLTYPFNSVWTTQKKYTSLESFLESPEIIKIADFLYIIDLLKDPKNCSLFQFPHKIISYTYGTFDTTFLNYIDKGIEHRIYYQHPTIKEYINLICKYEKIEPQIIKSVNHNIISDEIPLFNSPKDLGQFFLSRYSKIEKEKVVQLKKKEQNYKEDRDEKNRILTSVIYDALLQSITSKPKPTGGECGVCFGNGMVRINDGIYLNCGKCNGSGKN